MVVSLRCGLPGPRVFFSETGPAAKEAASEAIRKDLEPYIKL